MNKKGFTLIELLAVIVILAIIALIATPIILNVIEKAKVGSVESSMLGYVDAIEKQVMIAQVKGDTLINTGVYSVSQLTSMGVNVKGEKPDDTSVFVIGDKGSVSEGWATYENGKYKVYYDGKKAVADTEDYKDSKGVTHNDIPTPGTSTKTYTVGEAVYLDPTNLSTTCDASNSVSTTGTKIGCMKFYVIKDNGNSIDVLLDHNTTALVAYNTSTPYVPYAQASIKTQVDSDTTGWTSGLSPRLITANEVAAITGNTGWDSATASYSQWFYLDSNNQTQTATTQGASSYAWLFDYTDSCTSTGCNTADSSASGYWTSSPVSDNSYSAWNVYNYGSLNSIYVGSDSVCGIRPVITVQKSIFN